MFRWVKVVGESGWVRIVMRKVRGVEHERV